MEVGVVGTAWTLDVDGVGDGVEAGTTGTTTDVLEVLEVLEVLDELDELDSGA